AGDVGDAVFLTVATDGNARLSPPPARYAVRSDEDAAAAVGRLEEVQVDAPDRPRLEAECGDRDVLDVELEVGDVRRLGAYACDRAEEPEQIVELVDRVQHDSTAEVG